MDSPFTDLFARLSDLKLWQEKQQERLTRKLDCNDEASLTENIDFNQPSTKSEVIVAQPKTFDELLAEKLPQDVHKPVQVPTKPKKPFLKKGSGLLRYAGKNQKTVTKKKPITPLKVPNTLLQSKMVQKQANKESVSLLHEETNTDEPTPSEQTLYERESERELLVFEELEKKVENSSFSSTNSSVVRLLFSTPDKRLISAQSCCNSEITDIPEEFGAFCGGLPQENKLSDIMEADAISITSDEVLTDKSVRYNDEEKWSDGDSDVSTQENMAISYVEKRSVATMTEEYSNEENEKQVDCSEEILMKKMKELNDEIKTFRFQNEIVAKLKRDLDEEQRSFNKTRKKLIREIEDERFSMTQQLEEERKKLAKEKMVFEKYVKDFKNRPSKKERDEISLLKTELENVREVLKCKETKNSMSQARLRNRIKSLETENTNLQEEIEKLRKQNAKLTATAQRKPNDNTKVLHEINKNLTKLSQLKKTSTEIPQKSSSDICVDYNTNNASEESSSDEDTPNVCSAIKKFSHLRKITSEPSKHCSDNENKENLVDISKSYEQTFRKFDEKQRPTTDMYEQVLSDGSKEIKYRNGNIKKISPDGNLIQMTYSHGDFKETNLLEGTIKYYFKENQIWETTYADGTEVVTFPNGQIEKKFKDGSIEVQFPNKVIKKSLADGSQEISYPDGSVVYMKNGEKILLLPNGQKEIHTDQHMKREYPDGTIKIVYANGLQETRYANGRIRIKDKKGNLIMDSQS